MGMGGHVWYLKSKWLKNHTTLFTAITPSITENTSFWRAQLLLAIMNGSPPTTLIENGGLTTSKIKR